MKTKLEKSQVLLFLALAKQREDAKQVYLDILQAEQDQLALLVEHYKLPEGQYIVKQEGEDLFLLPKEEPKEEVSEKA